MAHDTMIRGVLKSPPEEDGYRQGGFIFTFIVEDFEPNSLTPPRIPVKRKSLYPVKSHSRYSHPHNLLIVLQVKKIRDNADGDAELVTEQPPLTRTFTRESVRKVGGPT